MSNIDSRYPEDSRYPPFLYTAKQNDAIDFPCSPEWLNYYHAAGITPKRVRTIRDEQPASHSDQTEYLQNEIEKLRLECFNMKEELSRLKKVTRAIPPPTFKGVP